MCLFTESHYVLFKSDTTFQLQAVLQFSGESEMRLFNLVSFPHLGCWDGNGNDVPAAVASSPALRRALSSVPAAHAALHCLLVRGRAWEAEAPCHGGRPLDR